MAPDQSALTAASALLKPAKWPLRARSGHLIWGECQGSGANPYRVVVDTEEHGAKCTCPSRKFPCKHALALMWLSVEDTAAFQASDVPDWVHNWMGRRRKGTGAPAASVPKSLDVAQEAAPTESNPAADARREEAARKRAQETRRSVYASTEELDLWIADQLRTGLGGFVGEVGERCRRIAARLVDAKAGALASRLDEMPSRILTLPTEQRLDAAVIELGKLVLLVRAWRAAPDDVELRREVIGAETREEVVANAAAPRVRALWEVLGERVATRRDGLVSQSTWLMSLDLPQPRFAQLLDFFPASAGRRAGAFAPGDRLNAELAFYPARVPLRAVVVTRGNAAGGFEWPLPPPDPLAGYAEGLLIAPWRIEAPLLLPSGRIVDDGAGQAWWRLADGMHALPLRDPPPPLALGADISHAVGLWDGARLTMIAAQTNWGRVTFDA